MVVGSGRCYTHLVNLVNLVNLVKLRMGRQRGGQACAARPCWRRSRRACLSFNKLHEKLLI